MDDVRASRASGEPAAACRVRVPPYVPQKVCSTRSEGCGGCA